jgi:subfamily B ATP-binding cassette protein MsbA
MKHYQTSDNQGFQCREKDAEPFEKETEDYYKIMNRLMWRNFLAHPVSEFLGTSIIIFVLWYGGSLILKMKEEWLQRILSLTWYFFTVLLIRLRLSTAVYSIEKGMASVDRIDKILEANNPIKDNSGNIRKSVFESEIEFRNVNFAYKQDVILKNINLTIPKGKIVALVGKSGSGKTTFAKLIPRFWDVNEGEILIDGINIKEINLEDLRGLLGYVSQEPVLFNDTFENNILFGVDSAPIDKVIEAAKVAHAHDFIVDTTDKYLTKTGDRGNKLSGGQKQRLSIARAVLKNPPLMILDEATSSLDTESEKLVHNALVNLMKNRTSIVIAHRLSTLKMPI